MNSPHHHNQFSKVSTLDDDDDHENVSSPGALSNGRTAMAGAAGGGVAAGALAANSFAMKPQPTLPGSSTRVGGRNQGYYPDDGDFANYGYQQQQQLLNNNNQQSGIGGYGHPAGYQLPGNNNDNLNNNNSTNVEDDFYNPYYAAHHNLHQQQQFQQQQLQQQQQQQRMALGMGIDNINQSNPSFYSASTSGVNTPGGMSGHHRMHPSPFGGGQDIYQQQSLPQGSISTGYFPPPPVPMSAPVPMSGSQSSLAFGPPTRSGTGIAVASTASSSPKRGPQGTPILDEMGDGGGREVEEKEKEKSLGHGGGDEKVLVQEKENKKTTKEEDNNIINMPAISDNNNDDERQQQDMETTTPLTTGSTVVN
ncbi:hypothetical protein BG004_002515 [Podila humilis]|nr:hypothetical protein BG004_002515 [Podila humilis]